MGYKIKLSADDCKKCAIKYCCILSGVDQDRSKILSSANKYAIYHEGEDVFPQDIELIDYVAIVRTGLVISHFTHQKHQEFIENIYFPCDLIDFNRKYASARPLNYKSMDTTNLCFFKVDLLKNKEQLYINYLEKRGITMAEMLSFHKSVLIEYSAEKRIAFFSIVYH